MTRSPAPGRRVAATTAERIDEVTALPAAAWVDSAPHLVVFSKRLWKLLLVGGAAI